MSDSSWSIRPATAEDGEFLTDMLVEAVNWSPAWKPRSRRRVLSDPRTAHYIAGWPLTTDLGVMAEAGSEPVGGAWVRFFPADDPAYGFVGPDVPELTIGVAAAWRGRGVGRALLRAVAALAAQAGIGRISLSVERKNFARGLYLSEGFAVVDASDPQSDTMVKTLADGRSTGAGKARGSALAAGLPALIDKLNCRARAQLVVVACEPGIARPAVTGMAPFSRSDHRAPAAVTTAMPYVDRETTVRSG